MPILEETTPVERQVPAISEADRAYGDLSLLDIFTMAARSQRFITKFIVVAMAIATVAVFLLPVRYTATTTILVPQQSASISSMLLTQLGTMGSLGSLAGNQMGLRNPNDLYAGLLHSRTVEDGVIQRFALQQEYGEAKVSKARETLERRTTIDSGLKDGLIRISVEDRDASRAAELANGYIEEYKKLSATLAITEAAQRRLFFERQLEDAKNALSNAEENLKRTQQSTGVIEVDAQAKALIESAAVLKAQVAAKEVEVQAMGAFATPDNPDVMLARQELGALRAQLGRLAGSEGNPATELVVPKGQIPEAALVYLRAVREVKYRETLFELIARQFEMAKLDEARQGTVIQVVDPAVPPDRRSFPKRTLIILLTGATALVIAIIFILLRNGLQRAHSRPEHWQHWQEFVAAVKHC
jgi:uncharacterized protein involved in exopolysaccharide biosynthesis